MFADVELATRIERAECELVRELVSTIASRHPDRGAFCRELAGGVVAWTGPDSPLNKVVGLGFDGVAPLDELEAVEGEFAERKTPLHFEMANLGDVAVTAALFERGYRLVGFENVSGCGLADAPPIDGKGGIKGLELERCESHELERWLDVVVAGFATPDTEGLPSHESFDTAQLRPIIADFAGSAGIQLFLATLDGEPAGGASMRCAGEIAQLCGATTLPAMRRRGVQTAMLAERLRVARDTGCKLAVVTTQPGSPSQRNVIRRGFDLLYTRTVLGR